MNGHAGGIPWSVIWKSTADQLDEYRVAGLQALLTEDVLRFAVVRELVKVGVAPKDIEAEWRRPGVPDAVDLVIIQPARSAIEFKFPREPRETNAAWTQHLGEVLKDIYRLAHMPADFSDRWCVQLLSNRMIKYLDGVADRHGVRFGLRRGIRHCWNRAKSELYLQRPLRRLHDGRMTPSACEPNARWFTLLVLTSG